MPPNNAVYSERIACIVALFSTMQAWNKSKSYEPPTTSPLPKGGLFTSVQAKVLGVERYALSRLEGLGNIERLAKGVYRMGGSPSTREEDVLAA